MHSLNMFKRPEEAECYSDCVLSIDYHEDDNGIKHMIPLTMGGYPFKLNREKVLKLIKLLENTYNNIEYLNKCIDEYEENEKKKMEEFYQREKIKKPKQQYKGYVYIAIDSNSGNCKIGRSKKHPRARVSQIRTSNIGVDSYFYFEVEDMDHEQEIHEIFSHYRIDVKREWFKIPKEELMSFLSDYNFKFDSL